MGTLTGALEGTNGDGLVVVMRIEGVAEGLAVKETGPSNIGSLAIAAAGPKTDAMAVGRLAVNAPLEVADKVATSFAPLTTLKLKLILAETTGFRLTTLQPVKVTENPAMSTASTMLKVKASSTSGIVQTSLLVPATTMLPPIDMEKMGAGALVLVLGFGDGY